MVAPAVMAGGSAALDFAGSVWGGQNAGGHANDRSNLHLVDPGALALKNQMYRSVMGGGGDFGFGSNYKQGKSQVQDFMASRGVRLDPRSGSYAGAMGKMTGQAMGMDAEARRGYMLELLNRPIQIAQTGGANFIPGSPSRGEDHQRQLQTFNIRQGRQDTYGDNYMVAGWGQGRAADGSLAPVAMKDQYWNRMGGIA